MKQLAKEGSYSPLNAAFIGEHSLPKAATPHSNIQAVLFKQRTRFLCDERYHRAEDPQGRGDLGLQTRYSSW
jgi:hypothetical protein